MNGTMQKMEKMSDGERSVFMRVLFGQASPSSVPKDLGGENVEWVDPSLNDSQKDAIRFALAAREIALIHGPPGVSSPSPPWSCLQWLTPIPDRQDAHPHRAHPPAHQAQPARPRLRTLQHLG